MQAGSIWRTFQIICIKSCSLASGEPILALQLCGFILILGKLEFVELALQPGSPAQCSYIQAMNR
jgi:hypothetical protein